jgi:membrane protease YdiL (CAAX protease family)
MRPILFSLLFNALLLFLLLVILQRKKIFAKPAFLALFFGVYFLDNLAITLTNHFPSLQIVPNHIWEGFLVCGWSGKFYSILLALPLLFLMRKELTRENVGVTLQQNGSSLLPASLVVLALAAWALVVGLKSPKGQPDISVLIYLGVMPGLNEELIYRGFLLAILNKLMPPKFTLFGASVGWGVIATSLLFGLLHGVWFDSSLAIHLDLIALQNSIISGFVFGWLREGTGSLLAPIVAHGLEDVLFFLPRMM